jgi:hypothetical protein
MPSGCGEQDGLDALVHLEGSLEEPDLLGVEMALHEQVAIAPESLVVLLRDGRMGHGHRSPRFRFAT